MIEHWPDMCKGLGSIASTVVGLGERHRMTRVWERAIRATNDSIVACSAQDSLSWYKTGKGRQCHRRTIWEQMKDPHFPMDGSPGWRSSGRLPSPRSGRCRNPSSVSVPPSAPAQGLLENSKVPLHKWASRSLISTAECWNYSLGIFP